MAEATEAGFLTSAQRSVLVTAAASELGDSYCSMAWGKKLAEATNPDVAASVIRGGDEGLDRGGQALARWARLVARARTPSPLTMSRRYETPASMTPQIFAITLFVALRLAFSSVNDALGSGPDTELSNSDARSRCARLSRSAVPLSQRRGVGGTSRALLPEGRIPLFTAHAKE